MLPFTLSSEAECSERIVSLAVKVVSEAWTQLVPKEEGEKKIIVICLVQGLIHVLGSKTLKGFNFKKQNKQTHAIKSLYELGEWAELLLLLLVYKL